MSFYFPTEFEEEYRRTNLALRYGALSSSFLGGLFLVLWHTHTVVYAILVLSEFLCMLLEFVDQDSQLSTVHAASSLVDDGYLYGIPANYNTTSYQCSL